MTKLVARGIGSLVSRRAAFVSASSRHHASPSSVSLARHRRLLHSSPSLFVVKPYLLADIGEGITECQVIQWFVQPGARVEQFDKICEVQSDKASVEITSRFDGVIKKLYYEPDDMAKVGKPLVDIDIQSDISPEDEALTKVSEDASTTPLEQRAESSPTQEQSASATAEVQTEPVKSAQPSKVPSGKHASLATPAVRHLIRELKISIEDVTGTGKDGRVLKEDVQRFMSEKDSTPAQTSSPITVTPQSEDQVKPLSPVQNQMFKTMTRSLSIPHFLYSDSVDFISLNALRRKLNASSVQTRISPLPFIVKAVSLSLQKYPLLNAQLDTTTNPNKPQLIFKAQHNIGIAIDTPTGLLVPVIRNVQALSIQEIAAEIVRLGQVARAGKLTSADLSGGTFTVSNIGSIGGITVAPVIVTPQVGIVGIGKARTVPAFDENGGLTKREESVFSWSADHRVVDGATVARCAEEVRRYLENVESMLVEMK